MTPMGADSRVGVYFPNSILGWELIREWGFNRGLTVGSSFMG